MLSPQKQWENVNNNDVIYASVLYIVRTNQNVRIKHAVSANQRACYLDIT